MATTDPSTSILVIHDPSLDPLPFLQRLTTDEELSRDDLRWDIDNKYYTAAVRFQLEPTGFKPAATSSTPKSAERVPVVLYLFADTPPNPLPPTLSQIITSQTRDITIAIRIRNEASTTTPSDSQGKESEEKPDTEQEEAEWETIEEAFEGLGMEVIDELSKDVDGEKSLDPLEEVRITIQTHLWPNMVRKPLPSRGGINLDFDDNESLIGSGESEYDEEDPNKIEFPVAFDPSSQPVGNPRLPEDEQKMWEREWEGIPSSSRIGAQAQFPSLQTLNEQLAETSRLFAQLKEERDMAQIRRMERLDRLERALDEDSDDEPQGEGEDGDGAMKFEEESGSELGPDEGEWERLDDWLDNEEGYEALDGEEEAGVQLPDDDDKSPTSHPPPPESDQTPHDNPIEAPGFEDDFSSFQSGPSRTRLNKNGIPAELPMDPTPLLMHLQSVRTELAGVTDEDERRVRAAREVMAVLGLNMDDIGDLGLDDQEEDGGDGIGEHLEGNGP